VVIGEPISSGHFSQRAAIHAAMASLLARVSDRYGEDVATRSEACQGIAMGPVFEEG
jgi:hypothetical protein